MCDSNKDLKNVKGDENMAVTEEEVKIDVKKSIIHSLHEVEQIRKGTLPKESYKDMIARVRESIL